MSSRATGTGAAPTGPPSGRRPGHLRAVPAALTILLLALAAVGCGSSRPPAGAGRLAVVAAENTWGDVTAQLGGGRVAVTSIVSDPAADPHTYETNARAAAAVGAAAVVVENGAGYDDFVDRLLAVDPGATRRVVNIGQVVGVSTGANPHLWYSPVYVSAAASAIAAALSAVDVPDARFFAANLRSFLASYQPYIDTLHTISSRHAHVPIGYTERVPGYLVTAASLRVATPASFAQAIEDGDDPSPADIAEMDRALAARVVRVLLYNSQVTSVATENVRQMAIAAGIPVVGVAETMPSGEPSFQAWQVDQARAILTALGG